MDKKELAQLLDGREYGSEIVGDEERQAKENNLVVVYGASDDCIELCGAIDEEVYGTFYLDKNGLIENECDDENCPYYERMIRQAVNIQPEYCNYPEMPDGWMFKFNRDIPYETFDILEDGEVFCKGIVFCLDDVN